MKRSLAVLSVALFCLALSACGSNTAKLQQAASTPQAQADTAKASATLQRCLPKSKLTGLPSLRSLATHAGRAKLYACAAPPAHRKALIQCVESGIGFHIPTPGRVQTVALTCIGKVA